MRRVVPRGQVAFASSSSYSLSLELFLRVSRVLGGRTTRETDAVSLKSELSSSMPLRSNLPFKPKDRLDEHLRRTNLLLRSTNSHERHTLLSKSRSTSPLSQGQSRYA